LEEKKEDISNIKLTNITEINKWMVASNLKLKTVKFTERMIEKSVTQITEEIFLIRGE
jgi:hypothetical protein